MIRPRAAGTLQAEGRSSGPSPASGRLPPLPDLPAKSAEHGLVQPLAVFLPSVRRTPFCNMRLPPGAILRRRRSYNVPTQDHATPSSNRRAFSPSSSLCHVQHGGEKGRRFSEMRRKSFAFRKKNASERPVGAKARRRHLRRAAPPHKMKAGSSEEFPKRPASEFQTLTTIMRGATLPSGTGMRPP